MTKEDEAKVLQMIKDNDEQNLTSFMNLLRDRKEDVWKHIINLGKSVGALEEYPEDYPQYYFRDVFFDIEKYCLSSNGSVRYARLFEFIGYFYMLRWLYDWLYDIEIDKFL